MGAAIEGRGTHEARVPGEEGVDKNPEARNDSWGPTSDLSFTGAVKLIVNERQCLRIMGPGHTTRAKPAIVRPAHKGTSCMRIAYSRLAPVILFLGVCAARHGVPGRGRSGGSDRPRSLHRQARARLSLETRGTLPGPRPDDVRHRPHEPDLAECRRSRQARLDALAHRHAARQSPSGNRLSVHRRRRIQRPATDQTECPRGRSRRRHEHGRRRTQPRPQPAPLLCRLTPSRPFRGRPRRLQPREVHHHQGRRVARAAGDGEKCRQGDGLRAGVPRRHRGRPAQDRALRRRRRLEARLDDVARRHGRSAGDRHHSAGDRRPQFRADHAAPFRGVRILLTGPQRLRPPRPFPVPHRHARIPPGARHRGSRTATAIASG